MDSSQKDIFKWKELLLALVSILTHGLIFSFWQDTVPLITAGQTFDRYGQLIAAIIATVVAASLFSLTAMFVRSRWISYPAAFIAMGIPFFSIASNSLSIGAFLASILFLLTAVHRVRKDFFFSIGFSISKSLRSGLGPYFTVFALIISLFYLTGLSQRDAIASLFPRTAFNITLKQLAEPFVTASGLSGIDPDATVDELLLDVVEEQLGAKGVDISKVSGSELGRLLQIQRTEIAGRYGITLTGGEKVGDVFYRNATERIEDFLGPYKRYLPFISMTAFFLAFKAITFPLYYLMLGLVWLLIKWLRAVKILKMESQEIEVERLTL